MTKNVLNTKISKVENKIQDTSGLGTTIILNKKIVNLSVKFLIILIILLLKNLINSRQKSLHQDGSKTDLVNLTDFDNKLKSYNRRITSNKTKHLRVQKKPNIQNNKRLFLR